MFVVDESSSIEPENFQLMRMFLESVVGSLDVGKNRVRVGIVTYSSAPTAQVYLDSTKYKTDILQFIRTLPYQGGGTNTGAALNFTLKEVFDEQRGSRKGVPKVAIVITDGESQDRVSEAAISLRRTGIKIYAVGIKDANQTELAEMASYPSSRHVFNVTDFTSLRPLKQDLQKRLCTNIITDTLTERRTDIKEGLSRILLS